MRPGCSGVMTAAIACSPPTLDPMRLTAAITQDGSWWVARCLEVEVTSQGDSFEEARTNLAEALELYFEDEPGQATPETPIIAPVDVRIAG